MGSDTLTRMYSGGTDSGANWTNPSNAWDLNVATYANRTIARNTNETTKYLTFQAIQGVPDYTITDVEVGVLYQMQRNAHTCDFRIVVGGVTTSTTLHQLPNNNSGTEAWEFASVFGDDSAPAWDYQDIEDLDVIVWGNNQNALGTSWHYIYECAVRVTMTLPGFYYAKGAPPSAQPAIKLYFSNTGMTHYLAVYDGKSTLYARGGTYAAAGSSDLAFTPDGVTSYSVMLT